MTISALVLASLLLHVTPWSKHVKKACREVAWVTDGKVQCDPKEGFPVSFRPAFIEQPYIALAYSGPFGCVVLYHPFARMTSAVIAHELGHCIGFPDSNDPRDLMWPHEKRLRWPWSRARFNERERDQWRAKQARR
jgi:hypothetical protein